MAFGFRSINSWQVISVAALSLVNAQSALAANESAKDMTCQEFIDLNPKAMTPVAWW
ncbi:HdeA/HdeB family chaperone, partial [Escherichia sp. R-CC3]